MNGPSRWEQNMHGPQTSVVCLCLVFSEVFGPGFLVRVWARQMLRALGQAPFSAEYRGVQPSAKVPRCGIRAALGLGGGLRCRCFAVSLPTSGLGLVQRQMNISYMGIRQPFGIKENARIRPSLKDLTEVRATGQH